MYLTTSDQISSPPKNCNITLWNHQLIMLQRCIDIESNHQFGIISDQPGSGKTFVVLSLINNSLQENTNFPKLTNIIVVTNNIYNQWLESILQFPKLSYKKFIDYGDISSLYYDKDVLTKYDILLTTPLYFNVIAQILKNNELYVYRLVIDEIDNTSSLILNEFNCHMRWFVSGSFNPDMVGCYQEELDNIVKQDGSLDAITCCCDPSIYNFGDTLEEPIYEDILCKDVYIDFIMDGIITESERCALNALDFTVLRPTNGIQLKSTNFKDILKQLQENFTSDKSTLETQLIDLDVSKNRLLVIRDLDNFHLTKLGIVGITSLDTIQYHGDNSKIIDNKLILISKQHDDILTQHTLNEDKLNRMTTKLREAKVCTICFEKLENNGIFTTECCQSLYCRTCIEHWLHKLKKRKCPHCKSDVDLYSDTSDKYVTEYNYAERNTTNTSNNNNDNKIYKVFEIIDTANTTDIHNDLKQLQIDRLKDKHQTSLSVLDNTFNQMKQEILQQEQHEIQDNIQRRREFTRLENDAKDRFRQIKARQQEYEISTSNILSKLDFIKKTLSGINTQRDRIIIFSDFSNIFNQITEYLASIQIGHVTLDGGNINDLQQDIDDYRVGSKPILMANSHMYGYGMNLQHTTHIILVHKLESNIKKEQLIARAQRHGRTTRLKIYQLLHKNEKK